MNRFVAPQSAPFLRSARNAAWTLAVFTVLLGLAHAQFGPPPPGTEVRDSSALKPPAGARVAVIEFIDLECPDCAKTNPVVNETAAKYRIPVIRRDFPLPFHRWSMDAAIFARWFDKTNKETGDEYRDQVLASQPLIKNLEDLVNFSQKFATAHGLKWPATVDPDGDLAKLVNADLDLGKRIGVDHTPTIWVVTEQSKGVPFVEVLDRGQLVWMIEQALKDTGAKTN